jgi:Type II secretion system (T2SS), protein M subtype b
VTLATRILREKRALIIPLALGLVLNVAAYALVAYPLEVKSAGAADRAAAAAQALQGAERENAAARALVAGKTRADQELSTFYDKVLPADLPAARRLTYATLPALARKTNVRFLERRFDDDPASKNARFGRLKIRVQFSGDYESLRRFIYELESAPEFVIIDDVTLAQPDPVKPLALTLELSTYYRLGTHEG